MLQIVVVVVVVVGIQLQKIMVVLACNLEIK